MRFAAEPTRPAEAAIVQGTIETVACQDSETRRVKPSIAGSWDQLPDRRKEIPFLPVGRLRIYSMLPVQLLSCPGGGSGNGHRTYSASGPRSWLPEN